MTDLTAREEVYAAAIRKWGEEAQMLMIIEEMSELTKEICKEFRGTPDREATADEIADVTIMLEQAQLIFGVKALVRERIEYKINRLRERIAAPRGEKTEGAG